MVLIRGVVVLFISVVSNCISVCNGAVNSLSCENRSAKGISCVMSIQVRFDIGTLPANRCDLVLNLSSRDFTARR